MIRFNLLVSLRLLILALVPACGVEAIEAILADHEMTYVTGTDTNAMQTSTSITSTSESSTGGPEQTTGDPVSTSTTGAEAGVDASSDMSTSVGSSSTGPAAPVCGDGNVDPGESCDDMNSDPDDGCKLCARDTTVFVSSEEWLGSAIGSLFDADQRCRSLAAKAGLPRFASYKAWLSDSTTSAASRLYHSPGRYILVNGVVVAEDWDALTTSTLDHPINVNEHAETAGGGVVWTGTLASGEAAYGATFCDDWTDHSDLQLAVAGINYETDAWWSYFDQNGCGSPGSTYCFEQWP